jgi:NAD(P)-dependent dehydrogenase (short-subunit alcohol dehydrogenase family)
MNGSRTLAVVVGARGGIGSALVQALAAAGRHDKVLALSRLPAGNHAPGSAVAEAFLDVTDEDSIATAATLASSLGEPRLVIVATGILHDAGLRPERSYRSLDAGSLARAFAINTIGPALVAKHFLPLLPKTGRSVFAALSARVGSIGDNRLGGWHAYRSSKAALNMLLANFAIELARQRPEALCLGLHPGTVDTALSRPYQANLPPGQLHSAAQCAEQLLAVIDAATIADSGRVLAWDGSRVPP